MLNSGSNRLNSALGVQHSCCVLNDHPHYNVSNLLTAENTAQLHPIHTVFEVLTSSYTEYIYHVCISSITKYENVSRLTPYLLMNVACKRILIALYAIN